MRRGFAALVAAALLLSSSAATAQPVARGDTSAAKAHFATGVERFEAGDRVGAREAFERAWAAAPIPIVGYNLALTHESLGDPVRTREVLRQVLAAPGGLRAERVERARRALADAEARIGSVVVRCDAPGASVRIAGGAPHPAARPTDVPAGEIAIEVSAEGFRPAQQVVAVTPGQTRDVAVTLEPVARRLASVLVHTSLPDAGVAIDGVLVARTPLATTLAVDAGTHRVEVRRRGYVTAGETIVVAEGASAEVTLDPQPDAAAIAAGGARLVLTLTPPDASVLVDGARREVPATGIALAEGAHDLAVQRTGYDTARFRITLRPADIDRRVVTLVPTPETRAELVSEASSQRTLGWVLGGAGLAVAAGGGVLLGVSIGNAGELDAEQAQSDDTQGAYDICGTGDPKDEQPCNDLRTDLGNRQNANDAMNIGGLIALPVGLVAVGVGIAVLATAPDAPSEPTVEWARSLRPSVRVGADGAHVAVGGSIPIW